MSCAGGNEEIRAGTTLAGGEIAAISDDAFFDDGSAAGLVHNFDDDFNPGDDFDIQDTQTAADDRTSRVEYLGENGTIVSVHLVADDDLGPNNCIVNGYATMIR